MNYKNWSLAILLIFLTHNFVLAQNQNDSITIRYSRISPFLYKGENLDYKQIMKIIVSNPLAYQEMIVAETNKKIGTILNLTGLTLIAWPIANILTDQNPDWKLLAIGVPIFCIGISLNKSADRHIINAIEFYNQGLRKKNLLSYCDFKLNLHPNGLAIQINF